MDFLPHFIFGYIWIFPESVEGTVKPVSSCEVVYYGVTSVPAGSVVGPPDSPLLRLSTFPLVCAYSFIPGPNQSVYLTLHQAGHDTIIVALPNSLKYCRTICGSSGCRCEAKHTPLDQIDHLLLVAGSTPIGCLCGYFRVRWKYLNISTKRGHSWVLPAWYTYIMGFSCDFPWAFHVRESLETHCISHPKSQIKIVHYVIPWINIYMEKYWNLEYNKSICKLIFMLLLISYKYLNSLVHRIFCQWSSSLTRL